jgi:hypothetical protein
MDPAELEREIDAALRRLPVPRAPGALTPRVMEAVRAQRSAPWYRQPWFAWPAAGRVAASAAALVLIAAAVWWMPSALEVTGRTVTTLGVSVARQLTWQPPESVRGLLDTASALQTVWRTLLGPLVLYASVFAVAMGGVFALCAAVLTRLTLGRAPA